MILSVFTITSLNVFAAYGDLINGTCPDQQSWMDKIARYNDLVLEQRSKIEEINMKIYNVECEMSDTEKSYTQNKYLAAFYATTNPELSLEYAYNAAADRATLEKLKKDKQALEAGIETHEENIDNLKKYINDWKAKLREHDPNTCKWWEYHHEH
jgi:predicted  nucleic acid-binding Zn-ribbon protein